MRAKKKRGNDHRANGGENGGANRQPYPNSQQHDCELDNVRDPIAILTADIHAREDAPECWADKDVFLERQEGRWNDIKREIGLVPVLAAGDVFDHWNSNPSLINRVIHCFNGFPMVCLIAGQHDLPFHSHNDMGRSAFGVIHQLEWMHNPVNSLYSTIHKGANDLAHVYGANWKQPIPKPTCMQEGTFQILLLHRMTWIKTKPFPDAPDEGEASKLEKECKGFDLIVTGDNHQSFVSGKVVNPGSIMPLAIDDDPIRRVCVLNKDGSIGSLSWDDSRFLVKETKSQVKGERDTRLSAFVDKLHKGIETRYSFRKNLIRFMDKNKVKDDVRQEIMTALEASKQ